MLYINPGEVKYQAGVQGLTSVIYDQHRYQVAENLLRVSACPQPVEVNWVVARGSSSPVFEANSPNDTQFTAGSFAQTRFGSSRQKTNLATLKQIQWKAREATERAQGTIRTLSLSLERKLSAEDTEQRVKLKGISYSFFSVVLQLQFPSAVTASSLVLNQWCEFLTKYALYVSAGDCWLNEVLTKSQGSSYSPSTSGSSSPESLLHSHHWSILGSTPASAPTSGGAQFP